MERMRARWNGHGRRHHYGHYGQCPYKFWEAPKLVRNVRTSFGRKKLFYLKKKVSKTVKRLTNLAIILKKSFLNFSRYGKKTLPIFLSCSRFFIDYLLFIPWLTRIWNGKNTFLATYENRGFRRYIPRKSLRGKCTSVGEWRMGRDREGRPTGRRGTGLDGKGRDGMERDGTGRRERDRKGWRGTEQGREGLDWVERDGTG